MSGYLRQEVVSRPPEVAAALERVSVVVPVYQGERTLGPLLAEIDAWAREGRTPAGRFVQLAEVVLVNDGAIDDSARVMEDLEKRYPYVRLVWLLRNFGQHPALLAGFSQTTGTWVATLDEDGQHDPRSIGALLDRAIETRSALVYAQPTNAPPHGMLRNFCSRVAKWLAGRVLGARMAWFHSFRLIDGDVARRLAGLCAGAVYLDVALSWMVDAPAACPLRMREEGSRPSGYTFMGLLGHFGRLMLAGGPRLLRWITGLGGLSLLASAVLALFAGWRGGTAAVWLATIMLFSTGLLALALGFVGEFVGLALSRALGRPVYVTVARPPRNVQRPADGML